jgi:hypothetical protein
MALQAVFALLLETRNLISLKLISWPTPSKTNFLLITSYYLLIAYYLQFIPAQLSGVGVPPPALKKILFTGPEMHEFFKNENRFLETGLQIPHPFFL